jgi:hypothetical protein
MHFRSSSLDSIVAGMQGRTKNRVYGAALNDAFDSLILSFDGPSKVYSENCVTSI